MIVVVSGCHPDGYELYGRKFLETFHERWPVDHHLVFYTETPVQMPRGENRSLWDIPGAEEFYQRHKDNPKHCGRSEVRGWVEKDRIRRYSYRYDTLKWFKQCIIPHDAARHLPDGTILVWVDADVVTFADIPQDFIGNLFVGNDFVSLGRDRQSSEIGFYALRLESGNHTRTFLENFSDSMIKDRVFDMKEWHSGWVFDRCLENFVRSGGAHRSMTSTMRGHVWFDSALGKYMDHLKGDARKKRGYSPESKIKWWLNDPSIIEVR